MLCPLGHKYKPLLRQASWTVQLAGIGYTAGVPKVAGIAAMVLMAAQAAVNPYVDARVCAGCHVAIAQTYRQTGMGRSLYRPAPANTIEDYDHRNSFYHALSDTHYVMIRRDGGYFQRRWQIGFGGREENVEEARIDYVIGSGNHSRTYLHRTPRGTFV